MRDPSPPAADRRQVLSALEKAGFAHTSTRGSHAKLRHPDGRIVIVPLHRHPLARGTLTSILRQAGMTTADLADLL